MAPASALVALVVALAVAAPLKVTVVAPGHAPTIGKRWYYTVHATRGGKPAAGRISAAIVDPLGTAHAVEFGSSTRKITNIPFNGTFRDFIVWPADARGIPLTLRITVRSNGGKAGYDYHVIPRR
jgi:hypothetical protein